MKTIELDRLLKARNNLQAYIEKEQYKGYDPYDTLNSFFPFQVFGKWGPPVAIQIQKRMPLNLRPLLGIKKDYNPKGIGLLLHAYSLQYQFDKSNSIKEKMDFLFNWLLENRTKGFQHMCWGYNFKWASSVKTLPAYSPTVVVSGFIAKGMMAYYEATSNNKALEVLESIAKFIVEDLPVSEDNTGICISYSTIERDCCYNASLLGAEVLSYVGNKINNKAYLDLAKKAADFVKAKQLENGAWNYSISLDGSKERKQIDFHQGYVLDSLQYLVQYNPDWLEDYQESIVNGMDYYRKHQFNSQGASLFRVPKKHPVDIHNQAQGIISLSRWSQQNPKYLDQANQIAKYTIENMQDPKGYFYYKSYPIHKIKTSFMRWSNAWMFLALTEHINALKAKK